MTDNVPTSTVTSENHVDLAPVHESILVRAEELGKKGLHEVEKAGRELIEEIEHLINKAKASL